MDKVDKNVSFKPLGPDDKSTQATIDSALAYTDQIGQSPQINATLVLDAKSEDSAIRFLSKFPSAEKLKTISEINLTGEPPKTISGNELEKFMDKVKSKMAERPSPEDPGSKGKRKP